MGEAMPAKKIDTCFDTEAEAAAKANAYNCINTVFEHTAQCSLTDMSVTALLKSNAAGLVLMYFA